MANLPATARVVIIGGGVVGVSSLYHLARLGWTDCVLLEKNELTAGSTWHAAGNCPNFAGSWSLMKLQSYSTALYRELAERVDYPINYHVNGAIRLAHTQARMQEFAHVNGMARAQGMDFEMLTPLEIKERYPFIELHDIKGASWDPLDGDIDPAQLTQALAKGARDLGAKIQRFCPVTGVRREHDEWIIQTEQGEIRCEFVVNAGGYYAQQISRWFIPYGGRELPQVTLAHQYLITEAIPQLTDRESQLPLLRDPDVSYYLRQEKDSLLLGPYERHCRAEWINEPMPADFSFQLFPDDLERLEPYIEDACARVPLLCSVGLMRVINGPIPYAPDGNPLIGPMPGVPNAFEACVFTFGVVQGGGAGKVLAEWVTAGETEWDMWSCDPRRFTGFADQAYATAKGIEIYSHEYAIHFPHYPWPEGRGKRVSPLYDRLAGLGAQFMAAAGWERAAWYARPGDDTALASCQTFERAGPWFKAVGEECRTVRDTVGICELPGFTRLRLSGAGTADWLSGLITGNLPRVGRLALAYFADSKGRIVTEMTIARLAADEFLLLGAAAAEWYDRDWLQQHIPAGSAISIENLSETKTCLSITGPQSRQLLSGLCDADLTLPWLSHQNSTIAGVPVSLLRVSYVGELGWEIHCDMAASPDVFEAVWAAGQPLGLRPFGAYAMDAMRIEKGYKSWKQDLSTDFTVLEAGLARFVNFEKGNFIGRDALLQQQAAGLQQCGVTLSVETGDYEAPYLSTVWQGEQRVGLVTSCNYGYRVGKSIALAVVQHTCSAPGTALEVEIFGVRYPATVAPGSALYDPDNTRLRA